jgi:hypothetical protein
MERSPITALKALSKALVLAPRSLSRSLHQQLSVPWAIIHGFFSWLYVIYYMLFK